MGDYSHIKALAFDHYGTLFNKDAVGEMIDQEFPGQGTEMARLWFATIQRYCFMNGLMERYQSWDEMTQEALTFAARSLGLSVDDDFHARLIAADLQLPPYPEVPEALARLASKRKLYVLSMASTNMLETTQKNANTLQYFTKIISCQNSAVYKPAKSAYQLGISESGFSKEQIGFVSGNSFDVVGSVSFGYPTFWINRINAPLDVLGLEPDLVVSNLDELADALDG